MTPSPCTTRARRGRVHWVLTAAILASCAADVPLDEPSPKPSVEGVSERWRTIVRTRAGEARDQRSDAPLKTLAREMDATLLDAYPDVYAERTIQLATEVGMWPAGEVRAVQPSLYGIVLRATEKLAGKIPTSRRGALTWRLADFGRAWEGEPTKDWNERRGTVAKALVASLRAVREAIDPAWNPENRTQMPVSNVPLPEGVPGIGGMSPEAIKDPEKRKLYEAAIAENDRKLAKLNEQLHLRDFDRYYSHHIVEWVLSMYREQPSNPAELESLAKEKTLTEAEASRMREAALDSRK